MTKNQIVPLIIPFTVATTVSIDNKREEYATEINRTILPASYLPSPPKYEPNSTYASKYNRAVFFFNHVSRSTHKKRMFGSSLYLVHRNPVIVFFCLSLIAIVLSLWILPLMAIPIVVGAMYLIISTYNLIIFIRNGSLLDDPHLINDSHFGKFGEQAMLSNIDFEDEWIRLQGDQTTFSDRLVPHLNALNKLQDIYRETNGSFFVLFYSYHYIEKYTRFPMTIIWQGILSLLILVLGVVLPLLVQCAWSKQSDNGNQICYMK
jgi:hypothetical protein